MNLSSIQQESRKEYFLRINRVVDYIDAYNEVINSNEYELMNEYGDAHRHGSEHGIESIFEFQHAIGTDGGDMTTWFWITTMPSDEGAGWGWGFGNPTQDLIDEFEPGDPRIIYTAIFEGDVFPSSFSDNGMYVVENNGSQTGYTCRKRRKGMHCRRS